MIALRYPANLKPIAMRNELKAIQINIQGIVQGVGFRPFVYRLAHARKLRGTVANTGAGVSIHAEGDAKSLLSFLQDMDGQVPPSARIITRTVCDTPLRGDVDFTISESDHGAAGSTLVPPDLAVCDDCLRELFDPGDRRYHYPFINCTNCGPRYTIIEKMPYDRPHTVMNRYLMCGSCRKEYGLSSHRRFHAQPNACGDCGPHVLLLDRYGSVAEGKTPLETAADLLSRGHVLAVKGLGGFHLCVDARNHQAVKTLRERKKRDGKPFAVMAADLGSVNQFAVTGKNDQRLLQSRERPVVLLEKRIPEILSPLVAPGNRYVGGMLPYTPLHYLLIQDRFLALVMTSANQTGEPIVYDNDDAVSTLAHVADFFLVHDREIRNRSDDSVVHVHADDFYFIRRSRGYAPVPLVLKKRLPVILGCGGEMKNTFCLTQGDRAFMSPHIGDLKYKSTFDFFTQTIDRFKRLLNIAPEIIAHDLHPDYLSTGYAMEQPGALRVAVQHHHAHVAGCMAEHGLEGEVIGIVLDGTGLGDDGCIWGGEVLIADALAYSRAAHLAYCPMPGGEKAVTEPWRMGLSYLYHAFGEAGFHLSLPFIQNIAKKDMVIISRMIRNRINSPMTSSLGRLFDAVAAILGVRTHNLYDGQAACDLEMIAPADVDKVMNAPSYETYWVAGTCKTIGVEPMIQGIVTDFLEGIPPIMISARFHHTLILLFTRITADIARETGVNRVVLSGGGFQNRLLLHGLRRQLTRENLIVFSNHLIPVNDGGISLGQAWVAAGST